MDVVAGDDPQRDRLLPPTVLLARVDLGEPLVGCVDRARVLERRSLSFAPEHFENRAHAASASTTRVTQSTSARESRRNASRSADAGP